MASTHVRVLHPQTLTASLIPPRHEVVDAGAYKSAEVQFRCLVAGGAGQAKLQHAAVNEPDAFKDISGAAWNLNAAGASGNQYLSVSSFLRYIRWVTDASVSGSPVALIDIIFKD